MNEVEKKRVKQSRTTSGTTQSKNRTKPAKAAQTKKESVDSQSEKVGVRAIYLDETRRLMAAIKEGAGNLSHKEIEEGLDLGRDGEGLYSGSVFGRYLASDGAKTSYSKNPTSLSQIANRARAKGWLPGDFRDNGLIKLRPFRHLEVPDGTRLTDRIQAVKEEREKLEKAQDKAVAALENLISTMNSCRQIGFMYTVTDSVDGDEMDFVFDGINVNLKIVIDGISSAFVFNEEFIGTELFD